ncbi:MAG: hypothetical protein Q4C91_18245 [Eubacteriales bacterium]|nr:hypothetical protein [Eubacteriales bacterium]
MREKKEYIGYEYKEVTVSKEQAPMYADCYENFGWEMEETTQPSENAHSASHSVTLRMKRNRKIINKMELTRLLRNFEACTHEIEVMEEAKTRMPTVWALVTGIIGTAFMAGSTFAVVHTPPIIWLCVLLAIPGFMGWILPYFLYRRMVEKKKEKYEPMIEEKLEEIYQICEKGHALL